MMKIIHKFKKAYLTLIGLLLIGVSFAQTPTRNGALDLTSDEGEYLQMNHDGSGKALGIQGTTFTAETWVKIVPNTASDMNIFRFYNNNNVFCLVYKSDSEFILETEGDVGDATWNINITSSTQFINNWVHVAFVNNGSNGRLYINGSLVYNATFTYNGNAISSFFPQKNSSDLDGKCELGGAAKNSGIKGKGYFAEVRLWNAALSASTILKYYDEEVNKSHPNWSNLKRYYHLSSQYTTNGTVYIKDVTGNYDATVQDNANNTVKDLYPPVKPAAFNNTTFAWSFTAADCQTSNIPVNWVNLRNSSLGYYTDKTVYYELTRTDNNSVLYSGSNNTYTDATAAQGTKYYYKVRTYWEINGTKYYSEDQPTSDVGTIKMQYAAPSNLAATTDKCNNAIALTWDWSSTSNPPNWQVQRATNTGFTTGVTDITTSTAGSARAYTNTNAGIETNYYYKVTAYGTDANGCTVSGTASSVATGFTSQAPSTPTGLTLAQDLVAKTLKLTWTNPTGNNADSYIIKRTDADGTNAVTTTVALGTNLYTDNTLTICKTYNYTIATVNECAVDGTYSTTELSGNISQDLSSVMASLDASKAYYPDKVRLEWKMNGSLSTVDRFSIYRTKANEVNYSLIKVLDNDLIFDDVTAIGGQFYTYKVVAEATCNTATIYSNAVTDLGFITPYGVANGHIEYAGGNAVKDVTVKFDRSSGASKGKSLTFDGNGDYLSTSTTSFDITKADFSVEAWVKTSATVSQGIFGKNDGDAVWEANEKVFYMDATGYLSYVGNGCNYVYSTKKINDGQWHHIAYTWDYSSGGTHVYTIYVDGLDVTDRTKSNFAPNSADNTAHKFYFAKRNGNTNEAQNEFNGKVDEIRLWSVARTSAEIVRDYKRVLNGNETGLAIYYRTDEGTGTKVYDASKTADDFNKRNATFNGDVAFSTDVPSTDQLGIFGITDSYGDYTVSYIPYYSGGETFKVTPTFGQHQFSPATRTIYVGDGSKTVNSLDFSDISFFTIEGKVTYKNSEVPVENVSIFIDGKNAYGSDNKIVKSDANGNYSINVPIGSHYLSVEKEGHVFSAGYFPVKATDGSIVKYEFTEDLTVNFVDSTKVLLAGRFVGGTVQGDKPIGLGLSKNNVGVADLQFTLQKEGYDLDLSSASIYNILSLQTDAQTGEYAISMIPEKWVISKASNQAYAASNEASVLDLSNSLTLNTDTNYIAKIVGKDTTYTISTYSYNQKLNFVIRTLPEILVLDADGSSFDGDSVIVFTNQTTQETDTLLLGSNSKFNYPVYQMGKTYNANVFVYEYYNNPLHPNGPLNDKVPVSEANITINDNIMVNPVSTQGKTNASGLFNYKFRAGIPDLSLNGSASYTKTFEVNAVTDKNSITWRSENPYRAYVLGSLPLAGTDFITYGPQVPDFVVHDPPGTNSYAYVEKGSSFTSSQNWEFGVNTNSTLDNTLKKGVKYGTGGSVTGPLFMFEQTDDLELGLSITKEYTQTGEYIETTTFTDRIETSSDPNDVGSDADLYIGKAYNAYFSKSKNLKPLSKAYCVQNGLSYVDYAGSTDNSIVLGIMDGLVMDEGKTATHFIYSQRQIVNEVVPNLMLVRDQLLRSTKYQSNFAANNRYYGLSNDNPVLDKLNDSVFAAGGDTTKISYVFKGALGQMDSVAFVNQQIGIWLSVIALNEAEKVNATLLKNVSFDGSAGKISSEISQDITSKDNFKRVHEWKVFANSAIGYSAAGLGFSLRSDWNMGLNLNTESGKSITNTLKFGYVLDESDEGDYYSVDVKTTKGTSVFSPDNFSNWINKREEWVKEMVQKGLLGGAFGGASFGTSTAAFKILEKFTTKASAQTSSRQNAYLSAALFTSDLGYHLYDMATMIEFRESIHNKMNNNGVFNISNFGISSPVFVRRGGASRCPYEGDEETSFYIDANTQKTVKLHTGTLQREVPAISSAPTIRTNIPESQKANFTLSLQNLSASGSNMWYKMGIVQSTNPDGAVILVDGLAPDGSFLIPAWGTVTKTLTLQKGKADVFKYDSIGVVLMSICQNDPTSDIAVIADTVYISAHFLPECSRIEIKNLQDNWVANYSNNNNVSVKLSGYDINLSTLKQIDLLYKTLSGTPITVKAFFKDTTSAAYKAYSSDKGKIAGSETTLNWDISALTDRQYQLRARAICTDGSIYETPYISGIIDRITPTAFGTPEPTDGIYGIGDDISLTFNETIETGLVRDNNIKVRAVLNGSAVSHATYLNFAGSNTAYANGISFNNKSFTTEFWLKRITGAAGVVFSKGAGAELTQFAFDASGNVVLNFGINTYTINPKSYYNSTYPENAWHHWAVAYDKDSKVLNVYLDDQTIKTVSSLNFSAKNSEILYVGYDGSGNKISANIHELRIWDKALTSSESYATMSTILSGDELNLYAYWPLDEATGSVAFDKAGARTLNTTATWGISPGGFAYDFNGAQYLSIPAQNVNITNETDFTLEFWFKGNKPSGTSTLFSSGKGDGNEVYVDGQKCLSITANTTGAISVLSNGKTFNAVTKNYFDNQWHHFALTVSRKGNTKAFVDGDLQNSTTSSTIYGIAESTMLIGARMSRTDPVTVAASQIFTGSLDEVRIWNTARNQDLIKLYKNNKLTGVEDGLVGYYPFDKYTNVMGAYVLQSTLEDRDSVSAGTAVAKTTSSFSSVTPAIRDVRPVQDIPFSYVVSSNKIIITPRVDAYKIEGQTLEISVSDIQDLYGNRMLSTQSWTAFVERNSIKWQQSELFIEKNPDTSKSFIATIANLGGTAYNFTLENVPAWLTPSITQGTLNANSTKIITFKISDAINVGYYEQGINLSTINGFNEKLTVKVRVAKTSPTWSVNENNYQFTANVFGKLKINGVYSTDTYDKVAAFVNGECRGVANVEYVKSLDAYEVFINIYSNEISNETVVFKVWDASDGSIHEIVTPNLLFAPNKIWGTSLNPIDIIADESISSTTILKKGWNWISVNLNTTQLATVDSLFAGIGTKADIIKGQEFYDQYDPQTGWLGTLTFSGGIKPEQMYKVFVAKEDTLKVIGKPFDVNTTTISVDTGWSYIGYVPQVSMTVKEALSSVNFVTNDVVKSQNSFAMYSGALGWIGSLKNMVPTKGYMLASKNKATITYPERSSLSTARAEEEVIVKLPAIIKYNENAYPSNMALVATIANALQTGMLGNEILLAFVGYECRGFASPTVLQDGSIQYYILVQGADNSEQISFKLYNADFSKSFRITNAVSYKNDIVVGRTEKAYDLYVNEEDSQLARVEIYPNPFETSFAFVTNLAETTILSVKLYNTLGVEVFTKQITVATGVQKTLLNDIELSNFSTGVYTVKIVSDSFNETNVLVKK